MNSGKGGAPATIDGYISAIVQSQRDDGVWVQYDRTHTSKVLDGLKMESFLKHGPTPPRRLPAVEHAALQRWKTVPQSALNWSSVKGLLIAAIIDTGIQALARPQSLTWTPDTIMSPHFFATRDDLTWHRQDGTPVPDTPAGLRSLQPGDFARLKIPPGKADKYGERYAQHPAIFAFCPTTQVNAARQLQAWELAVPCPTEERGMRKIQPLFHTLDGAQVLSGVTSAWVLKTIRAVIRAVDGSKAASQFELRVLRVTGATRLKQAGVTEQTLRATGRWGTDIAHIYQRGDLGEQLRLSQAMAISDHRALPQNTEIGETDGDLSRQWQEAFRAHQ